MTKKKTPSSFRTIILILLTALIAVFAVVLFVIQRTSALNILVDSEEHYVTSRTEVAYELLRKHQEESYQHALTLAGRTDTADYLRGGDTNLYARGWVLSANPGDHFDFVILRDEEGEAPLRSATRIDGVAMSMATGLEGALSSMAATVLREAGEAPGGNHGIVLYMDTPYYVSIAPVLAQDGGVLGSVTVCTRIDDLFFASITQFSDYAFAIRRDPDAHREGDVRVEREGERQISSIHAMRDYYGNPIELVASTHREAYQLGMGEVSSSTLLIVLLLIGFVAVLYVLVIGKIIRPIERLSRDIPKADEAPLDPENYGHNTEYISLCGAINTLVQRLNDSSMSMSVFDHILNGMNIYLYVSDPITGEVVFLNDKMREHFDISGGVGRPCWVLLEREGTDRCAYCPLPELLREPDRVISWEEHNARTGHTYRNTDSLIDWIDGRKMHLQHRVDISDIKETEARLKRRLDQQQIMSEIARGFIDTDGAEAFVKNALKVTGEFVDAGRALVSRLDPDTQTTSLAYEWVNEALGITPLGDRYLPYGAGHPFYEQLIRQGKPYALIENPEDLEGLELMRRDGVRATLAMPITVGERLWGFMSVSVFGREHHWSTSDIHLFTMISSVIGAVINRTDAEEALLRMSSISESSPNFIAYVNPQGTFEYINTGSAAVTGYSVATLFEGGLEILFDPAAIAFLFTQVFKAVRERGQYIFELPFTHGDGDLRLLSLSAFTIEGHPDDIGLIGSDVTEQRRMERELITAKEDAERSNAAKSEFLSRMSHEMRTPMNAIIGMTGIARGSDDPEKKEYCLERIDEASTHLLGVINDILDMSKIEANKFDLSYEEFDFERMLKKVSDIITFRVDEKEQTFLVDIDPDIPRAIIGDEQRLAQVITNLLANATKFTPQGGSIRLSVRKLAEDGEGLTLEFDVTDTGIGVSPEQQGRLFTAFEQADGGVSRKFGGTGLGLAISKRIVELMGGSIRVESEAGQGSSFIFTIRARRGTGPAPRTAGVNMAGVRVLAVDDAPDVLEYFQSLAGRMGFACEGAASGEAAVDLLRDAREPYNIAFVDWKMPGMDGIALARHIKENAAAPVTVIMISGADWNGMEEEAKDAGVDRFVAKPLFASTIVDCINQAIGAQGLEQPPAPEETPGEARRYDGYRALLAEDVEINREIVQALLSPLGIQVDEAENGLIAVEKFQQDPDLYDIIFMDIHMPEMDGYAATRAIRALDLPRARTIPIVAMTANAFREDVERCLAAGMNDHISKPIDVDTFYDKLAKNMPPRREG